MNNQTNKKNEITFWYNVEEWKFSEWSIINTDLHFEYKFLISWFNMKFDYCGIWFI